jgi:hypothetical protein
MWKKLLLLAALGLISAGLPGSPASAQAIRTWVSGVGDDVNPCSRTAPCKTWAGAISKTTAGGEIDALDPGGFGALTITKAITLDGGGGQVASVLVSGTNGIVVAAGTNDIVILRNLRINGLGSGLNGILYNSGAQVSVENCDIFGFTQSAISANTSTVSELYVTDTYITNSANGITLATTSAGLLAVIDHTRVYNVTTNGIAANSGIIDTEITNSAIGSTTTALTVGGGSTRANLDTSTIFYNTTALNAAASGSIIRISNNLLYDNSTNFTIASGATIATTGNKRVKPAGATNPNGTVTQQ